MDGDGGITFTELLVRHAVAHSLACVLTLTQLTHYYPLTHNFNPSRSLASSHTNNLTHAGTRTLSYSLTAVLSLTHTHQTAVRKWNQDSIVDSAKAKPPSRAPPQLPGDQVPFSSLSHSHSHESVPHKRMCPVHTPADIIVLACGRVGSCDISYTSEQGLRATAILSPTRAHTFTHARSQTFCSSRCCVHRRRTCSCHRWRRASVLKGEGPLAPQLL
jgi:hypothetical protein